VDCLMDEFLSLADYVHGDVDVLESLACRLMTRRGLAAKKSAQ